MNRTVLIVLGVAGALGLVFALIFGIMLVTTNNTCVRYETTLQASKDVSKSQYDNFWKSVKEVAQVPSQYSGDMQKVYLGLMEGRYKGKNPLMNWIQESNPNFDASLYKQVQQVIESGRNDFKATQTDMIDKARAYKSYVKQFPTSMLASFVGKPSADFKWSDYEPVTSDETANAFETRKDKTLDVFSKGDAR
jgi:hypothetical protein